MKALLLALSLTPACDAEPEPVQPTPCGVCLHEGPSVRWFRCDTLSSGYCLIQPDLGLRAGLYLCEDPGPCGEVSVPEYDWNLQLPQ